MAYIWQPECKNGHGPMSIATDPSGRTIQYEPGIDRATAFVAYECDVCAYREFRDSAVLLPDDVVSTLGVGFSRPKQ